MQNYTEFNFKIQPLEPWNEILMAELMEIGFDSFTEEIEGIKAYIPTDVVNEENFKSLEIFSFKGSISIFCIASFAKAYNNKA